VPRAIWTARPIAGRERAPSGGESAAAPKGTCLRVQENGRAYIDALNALIRSGKGEPLIAFDAELFAQFVNRIRVFSRTEAGFEMTCGMTLREPLTGRVCDTFRMAGETEPFGDPFRQAEHTYSLIQEAPDGNQ
jgi:hypothetical protein